MKYLQRTGDSSFSSMWHYNITRSIGGQIHRSKLSGVLSVSVKVGGRPSKIFRLKSRALFGHPSERFCKARRRLSWLAVALDPRPVFYAWGGKDCDGYAWESYDKAPCGLAFLAACSGLGGDWEDGPVHVQRITRAEYNERKRGSV